MEEENDYKLDELVQLIHLSKTDTESAEKMTRYLRLQALFVYFQYTVASVRLQEQEIKFLTAGNWGSSMTGFDSEDHSLKMFTSAITAYSNLRTCLNFSRAILSSFNQDGQLKTIRQDPEWVKWAKNVIEKRNRVTSHPYEKDKIVWKRSNCSDDGSITFRAINISSPTLSPHFVLTPRKDLEKYREYLKIIIPEIKKRI